MILYTQDKTKEEIKMMTKTMFFCEISKVYSKIENIRKMMISFIIKLCGDG